MLIISTTVGAISPVEPELEVHAIQIEKLVAMNRFKTIGRTIQNQRSVTKPSRARRKELSKPNRAGSCRRASPLTKQKQYLTEARKQGKK